MPGRFIPATCHTSGAAELHHLVMAALLIGAVATIWGYEYGTENQTEYVLAAKRALDSGFLSRDFYTNTTAGFGPRTYFIQLIALLGVIAPLPTVFFLLALMSNAASSVVTALATYDLFGSRRAGILAASMVLSLDTLPLGDAAYLAKPYLLQATLAAPLALAAIWAGVRGRLLLCAMLAGIGSLLHPLVGGGSGAVVLAGSAIITLVERPGRDASTPGVSWGRTFLAWLVFLALFSLSLLPYAWMERLETLEFISILAHFRAPHHYLPSSFPLREYFEATCFVSATLLAWYTASRHFPSLRGVARLVALMIGIVLLGCLGGHLFVEVIPTRVWTSAQTFRLLLVVKWLGFVGAAGVIASRLRMRAEQGGDVAAAILLLGLMSPETMLVTQGAEAVRSIRGGELVHDRVALFGVTAVAAVSGWVVLTRHADARFLILVAIGLLAVALAVGPWRVLAAGLASAATAAGLLLGRAGFPKPHFTLTGIRNQAVSIAPAVRESTAPDAVILTPPLFGMLRLLSDRAIVADFKLFPFRDQDMRNWYRRLQDSYGEVSSTGSAAASDMDAQYRTITDAQLEAVREKYGASFAVLYSGTATRYPVIAAIEDLKLIALTARPRD